MYFFYLEKNPQMTQISSFCIIRVFFGQSPNTTVSIVESVPHDFNQPIEGGSHSQNEHIVSAIFFWKLS